MGLVQDLILPTRRPPVWPYLIEHSALFDGVDDCLSRTPVSAGDRRKWTFSLWPKLCRTANQTVFAASTVGYYRFEVRHINGAISVGQEEGNNNAPLSKVLDGAVDYTGLYHIVVSVDTANAVAEDRVKVYINGTRRIQFSTNQNIPQNHDTFVNATVGHYFGCGFLPAVGGRYLFTQMYASEFHFIDGQALTPDAFGEWSDKVTGLWTPKAYTGTYGTNGCKLDFSNAAALGDDVSGNGNNWTVNGAPVQTLDTPTNNYCTLNALDKSSGTLLTRGNLMAEYPTGAHHACRGTRSLPTAGKWYWECARLPGKTFIAGIGTGRASLVNYVGAEVHSYGYSGQDGLFYHPGFTTSSGVTLAEGDILGVAYDADDATLVFYKNGVKITGGSGGFSAIPEDTWIPIVSNYSASASFPGGTTMNFGATGFAYTPPEGFLPLSASAVPGGTVVLAGSYTGNGSADGPFVNTNCALETLTIGVNAYNNDGTDNAVLLFFANGFKLVSGTDNANAVPYTWTGTLKYPFNTSNAQTN
ncbi:MAG: hypothetical protein KUA35_09675 [Pseudodesulfovibrio sp.]|uniref:SPla/RYanodine receptor SPRY domain-containing protein n=1 Tax=Pseudodesulfovibrio aespoeensis (strain ATCC 700646 / DSM 10631 / Aspo-2) TaxID=643562 RepID=E6VWF7_PSEA9|nr:MULTISPECIES: SPRY domain-containing protein [Pseudodesulfovibrio]MBU4193065.1 hypothetical protein [Pseudomonadota bacterium]ADU61363.1 SPla/RYanodine receptor SPRY domain-containing protein [Pseudodesulfovibrio aespoeensis Aspo-2]MBU4243832.1 hypothetical protein [Pseudomonadota bacterium]MBU4378534.1 hypothetical protein [Pseudomonadota bacterium]MBU4474756.1 hypothetical protein [Pseudomonadota bacterium]